MHLHSDQQLYFKCFDFCCYTLYLVFHHFLPKLYFESYVDQEHILLQMANFELYVYTVFRFMVTRTNLIISGQFAIVLILIFKDP